MKRRMQNEGGGLPLAKFAEAKTSGYDKRERLEKQRKQHLNKVGKYKKLLHRMEAQGKPLPAHTTVKDNVADLEQQFFSGDETKSKVQSGLKQHSKKRRHEEVESEEAGPNQAPSDFQGPAGTNKKHKHQQGQHEPQQLSQPDSAPASSQKQKHHSQPETGRQQQEGPAPEGGKHSKHASKPDKGKHAGKHVKPGQKPSRLHRLLSEQEQRQAEAAQAKKQAQEARAQRQAQVEAVQRQRKKDKQQFFKRTRTGQPLMRYRMEKILAELQRE